MRNYEITVSFKNFSDDCLLTYVYFWTSCDNRNQPQILFSINHAITQPHIIHNLMLDSDSSIKESSDILVMGMGIYFKAAIIIFNQKPKTCWSSHCLPIANSVWSLRFWNSLGTGFYCLLWNKISGNCLTSSVNGLSRISNIFTRH